MAEEKNQLIIRLFNPSGIETETMVNIPALEMEFNVVLNPYEIKTIAVDPASMNYFETDLMERKI